MEFALVLLVGLVAGTLGGVIGFGTSIMVMPALVLVFGPQEAVPMAVASVLANGSRVAAWWREIDWRAVAAYGITGLVGAGIGFLTGVVASTGPVNAPFFLAYGLGQGRLSGNRGPWVRSSSSWPRPSPSAAWARCRPIRWATAWLSAAR